MATPRFFSTTPLLANQTIELAAPLAHHALRVLRMKSGSDIILFDGKGGQFPATLIVDGKKGLAEVGEHQALDVELQGSITLVQGIAAGDKMDWVIEKAVELGATQLVPIAAQRSVLQLRGERLAKRQLHWEAISRAASEQCGRNRIMQLTPPQTLNDYLSSADLAGQTTLFCHPEADLTLDQAVQPQHNKIALLVGPEGGWSLEEQDLVSRHALTAVRFGGRVLRTETAGLALIAAVTALQGWG